MRAYGIVLTRLLYFSVGACSVTSSEHLARVIEEMHGKAILIGCDETRVSPFTHLILVNDSFEGRIHAVGKTCSVRMLKLPIQTSEVLYVVIQRLNLEAAVGSRKAAQAIDKPSKN